MTALNLTLSQTGPAEALAKQDPSPPKRVLRCGRYDVEVARAERRQLEIEREAYLRRLVRLSARERQAARAAALRFSFIDDAAYTRNLFAHAERQAQRCRVRPRTRAVRRRAVGRVRATSAKSSNDPAPDGDDDEPAKSKAEQTVIVVETRNQKLGIGAWATTLPVRQTCPTSCPLLDNGCYAQRGPGGHVARLERNAKRQGLDALDLAHEEARLIRRAARKLRKKLKGREGPPLRLHVTGDAVTIEAVRVIVEACSEWPGPVWTYTHGWREVPREAWGKVSVLASVETPEDVRLAVQRGYAPAITAPAFPSNGGSWREGDVQFIPCPAELLAKEERQRRAEVEAGRNPSKVKARPRTCVDCRKCFDAEGLLRRDQGIGFFPHGSGQVIAADALNRARRKAAPPLDSEEVRDSGNPPKPIDTASTDREVSE